MATAVAFDEWYDAGMAFGEEEVRGHLATAVAEERIRLALDNVQVIERLLELPKAPKPKWWRERQNHLIDVCTWYAVVAELPGIDRGLVRHLPSPSSAEGKKLTARAHNLDPVQWADTWVADVRLALVRHVTLGRACVNARKVSGWTKKEKSLSNKVAHALVREHDRAMLAVTRLGSLS